MAVSSATAGFGDIDATTSGTAETLFSSTTEGKKAMALYVINRSSNLVYLNCQPLHAAADFVAIPANASIPFRHDGGGGSGPRGQITSVTGYAGAANSNVSWAITEE